MLGSLHAHVQTVFPAIDDPVLSKACAADARVCTVTYPARVSGDTHYGISRKYELYKSSQSCTKQKTQTKETTAPAAITRMRFSVQEHLKTSERLPNFRLGPM